MIDDYQSKGRIDRTPAKEPFKIIYINTLTDFDQVIYDILKHKEELRKQIEETDRDFYINLLSK